MQVSLSSHAAWNVDHLASQSLGKWTGDGICSFGSCRYGGQPDPSFCKLRRQETLEVLNGLKRTAPPNTTQRVWVNSATAANSRLVVACRRDALASSSTLLARVWQPRGQKRQKKEAGDIQGFPRMAKCLIRFRFDEMHHPS